MARNNRQAKRARAALAKQANYSQTPDTDLQVGARSTMGHSLNYTSVNTLDPRRLAAAFAQADVGQITEQATLYNLIEEQDAHIFSNLAKRKRAITSLGWQLTDKDDAKQGELNRAKELEDMLRDSNGFEDAQYDLADAIGKGFSMIEMEWSRGDVWLPAAYHAVPQQHFVTDQDTGVILYNGTGIAEPLRPNGWITHIHKAKSGYIEQAALFRVLAWTYAYKAYNIQDMQRFLELYGLPLRLGKYPPGIDKTARDSLLRAVRSIGNDGAGVVPANMTIDFIQAQSRGNITDFLSTIQYWEEKQSQAILGGELDGKAISEARIMTYDKVRREILLHDVRQMEPTINQQLIMPINMYNKMFTPDRMPKFTYLTQESVDQQKMVNVLEKASGLGMEIEVEYAHEIMQIPRAKEGAKLLGKPASNPTPPSDKPPENKNANQIEGSLTRLAALAQAQGAQADLTDAYTAQLAALGAKHEAALVQKLAAVINEAGDFDQAIEGIEALAIDFKVPALAEVIALGMAAANLGGRSEVLDGH